MVSSKAVVTAAHCVVNQQNQLMDKENFRLLFGSVDITNLTGNEALREVAGISMHPGYKRTPILEEDIAIMIVKGQLQFSDTISPICLLATQTPLVENLSKTFYVLGFGSNDMSAKPSQYLKYGRMSIIRRRDCNFENVHYGWLSEYSAFCAKSSVKTAACSGDSGGK